MFVFFSPPPPPLLLLQPRTFIYWPTRLVLFEWSRCWTSQSWPRRSSSATTPWACTVKSSLRWSEWRSIERVSSSCRHKRKIKKRAPSDQVRSSSSHLFLFLDWSSSINPETVRSVMRMESASLRRIPSVSLVTSSLTSDQSGPFWILLEKNQNLASPNPYVQLSLSSFLVSLTDRFVLDHSRSNRTCHRCSWRTSWLRRFFFFFFWSPS